jgi:hypothetical protein
LGAQWFRVSVSQFASNIRYCASSAIQECGLRQRHAPACRLQCSLAALGFFSQETGQYYGVSQDKLTSHYVYSSVLGARVVEIDGFGQKNIWIYAGGQRIATAIAGANANTTFEHHNPVTSSWVTTNGHSANRTAVRQERDPMNGEIPPMNPGGSHYAAQNPNQPLFVIGGDPSDLSGGCTLDNMPTACSNVEHQLDTGAAVGGLFVGGKMIGFWDFTGHGGLGLDYLRGGYGSIRIGIWSPGHDTEGLAQTNEVIGTDIDEDTGEPVDVFGINSGYTQGHWEYSLVNASFGQKRGVQKTYSRTFHCNKTNRDIFHRLRTHFPKFANFNGNFGPGGLASASVSFGSTLITKGATISIHNVNSGPTLDFPTVTFDVAVKVATVSTQAGRAMGFSFDTLPGHVLYPASISFFAVQGDQGSISFTIGVDGQFASKTSEELFNHAGGDDLENKIWNNVIDNVERYCGHEPQ